MLRIVGLGILVLAQCAYSKNKNVIRKPAAEKSSSATTEPINGDVPKRVYAGYSFAPIVGYDPTFGVLLGAAAFRGVVEPPYSNASVLIYGTTKRNITLEVHDKIWTRDRLVYNFDTYFTNFFDPYYGEGNRTLVSAQRNVDNFSIFFTPSFGYRFDRRRYLFIFGNLKYRDEQGVDSDASKRVFGTDLRPDLGISLLFDSRNNEVDSTSGGYAYAAVEGSPGWAALRAGASDFLRLDTDFRYFYSPAEWLVLAGQARAGTSAGDPGYLYRFTLGGGGSLRGYPNNRFRGNAYYMGQLEARFRPLRWLGLALFGGLGDIADRSWADFRSPLFAQGLGVRIGLPPDFVAKARLDIGVAKDQTSIYLSFNEAF